VAVVATAAVDYSFTPGSYAPLMVYPSAPASSGSVGSFDPWPSAAPPVTPTSYLQRVWDSGGSNWCYYTKFLIDPTPAAGETTPPYTGAISAHSVILISE
jgi:hypothetical protein